MEGNIVLVSGSESLQGWKAQNHSPERQAAKAKPAPAGRVRAFGATSTDASIHSVNGQL